MAIPRRKRAKILVLLLLLLDALGTLAARTRGYRFGRKTLVRCHSGHLYTTIWIPGGSLKALRLGWWRVQFCPVGRHWSIVTPVKETDLSLREKLAARRHKDIPIP
jgi:hypothetical protein